MKAEINKILFVTLSNIGDAILTLPVIDNLRQDFPQAKITVVSGPRPKEIFENNPAVSRFITYDKHAPLREKFKLVSRLKKEKFDLVVDLRHSMFSFFLPAKIKAPAFLKAPRKIKHMRNRHLYKIKGSAEAPRTSLYISRENEDYISRILRENGITDTDKIFVIAPGSRSSTKRWPKERFAQLADELRLEFGVKIVLVGDKDDLPITQYILRNCRQAILDLTAKTSLLELAALLKRAGLLITNDSATMHLAGYLNIPTVALFGPTNEEKYGPWSEVSGIVKKEIFCRPCEKAQCRFGTLQCMQIIRTEDVLRRIKDISSVGKKQAFRRILIVRTDRVGDVLLSTPVIRALREAYPQAYLAMLVGPYAKEIVEGNPYLDEVIVYDKEHKEKSWLGSLRFARRLKKKKFDLAIILHPTNRVHLITYFSGIRRRVGFNRKMGFLLTDRVKHTKHLGERHELEYNLDLLRYLGIEAENKDLYMPLKPELEKWAGEIFAQAGIRQTDKLLAIHPGASCPSKIWPPERFAEVSDRLAQKHNLKIILVAGPKDMHLAQEVSRNLKHPALDLSGKTSVSQLASVLKRCCLFISNDSGPVHMASALDVPVISIFGRSQKGLSPKRWGPVGKRDRVAHQAVGCVECLAHNCVKNFACLRAVTADYVVGLADSILQNTK